ncbi:hypothetical protein ACLKA7_017656, partial [Drosophila subpalustris]
MVTELALHDVMNVAGVAADLSHISTSVPVKAFHGPSELDNAVKGSDLVIITAGVARRPGMDREQLFEVNANVVLASVTAIAKSSAHALIAIVTNPINAVVPMAAEYLKRKDVFDANRLFGVTTLDCVRAESFIGNYMNIDPKKVEIPVIGGHAGNTILPIMSQCKPPFQGDNECKASIINRIQMGGDEVVKAKNGKGSATLSMAFATARFANALLLGLKVLQANAQIQHAAKKASRATASLARLMANIGGPTQSKRRLLLTITNTILLYGCEVWAEALEADSRRKVYASVQRTAALRIASAYRTVSEAAVLVISSCIPIDLLAFECRKRW